VNVSTSATVVVQPVSTTSLTTPSLQNGSICQQRDSAGRDWHRSTVSAGGGAQGSQWNRLTYILDGATHNKPYINANLP
jgi:hypothetical protein